MKFDKVLFICFTLINVSYLVKINKKKYVNYDENDIAEKAQLDSGFTSKQLIFTHISNLKERLKDQLSKIQVLFVNKDKRTAMMDDDLTEPIWEPEDLEKQTDSELYEYHYIKKLYNQEVDPLPETVTQNNFKPKPWETIWGEIFTSPNRKFCNKGSVNPNLLVKKVEKPASENQQGIISRLPSQKPNMNYNFYGFENSGYLFDHLDYLLQKRLAHSFKSWWEQVRTLPPKIGIDDPYNAYNQAVLLSELKGTSSSRISVVKPDRATLETSLIKFISSLKPNFPGEEFLDDINIPTLATVYEKFKWVYNANDKSFFRKKLDQYDFDGNGRLSAREFIFLTIWENKGYLSKNFIKFPFYKVIRKYITPIFDYADCRNLGFISAEQLWKTIKTLKKEDQNFSLFTCVMPNGDQRTSSINDFILKNGKVVEGFISKDEFVAGILLGYWDRQISGNKIFDGDEINKKFVRWEEDKVTDKECELIKSFKN